MKIHPIDEEYEGVVGNHLEFPELFVGKANKKLENKGKKRKGKEEK